jgi:hypothetical protein
MKASKLKDKFFENKAKNYTLAFKEIMVLFDSAIKYSTSDELSIIVPTNLIDPETMTILNTEGYIVSEVNNETSRYPMSKISIP